MQIVQTDRIPFAQGAELSGAEYLSPAGRFMVVGSPVDTDLPNILEAVHRYGAGTDRLEIFIVERQQEIFTRHIIVGDISRDTVFYVGISCGKRSVERFGIVGNIHLEYTFHLRFGFPFQNIIPYIIAQAERPYFRTVGGTTRYQRNTSKQRKNLY